MLWVHFSARCASLPEFTDAYSTAHLAAFVPPPIAPPQQGRAGAGAVAAPLQPPAETLNASTAGAAADRLAALVHRGSAPPPARLLASVLTSVLSEVASDPLLAASAARWGSGVAQAPAAAAPDAAVAAGALPLQGAAAAPRAALRSAPASTTSTSTSASWAGEKGLLAGGLTFAALRQAGGDAQAALTAVRAQGEAAVAVAASLSASRGVLHAVTRPVTAPALFGAAQQLPAHTAAIAAGVLAVAAPGRGGGGGAGSPSTHAGGLLAPLPRAPPPPPMAGAGASAQAVSALYDTSLPAARGEGAGDASLGALPPAARSAVCAGGGALFSAAASSVLMGLLGEIAGDMVRGGMEWALPKPAAWPASRGAGAGAAQGSGSNRARSGRQASWAGEQSSRGSLRSAFGARQGSGAAQSLGGGQQEEELVLDAEEEAALRARGGMGREVVYGKE